jgi:uncharacterized membrane protein (UPF0127 family)
MTPLLLSLLLAVAPGAPDGGIVMAKGHKFQAEVARTPEEQARGLMYRQSMAKDRCMIFLYDEDGNHRIWMKNCLIALDVVWVKADGTVVETSERTPPCSPVLGDDCPVYGGAVAARHFVEFPAGTLARIGLKKGDRLGWNLSLADAGKVVGGAQGRKPRP